MLNVPLVIEGFSVPVVIVLIFKTNRSDIVPAAAENVRTGVVLRFAMNPVLISVSVTE